MLLLLAATLVVFALELLPLEVTALSLLGVLIVLDLVSVHDALSGFSNRAVIAIGALFVLSYALGKAGLIDLAADRVGALAERSRWLGIALLLVAIAVFSGFLNNTAIVAVFIPLATSLASRLGMSPSKLLLPVSYASIFGGTLTLIGTSTNLIVSGVAADAGQPEFGMFEFTPLGALFCLAGLTYTIALAPRLLPERVPPTSLLRKYELGEYITEIHLDESSQLVGSTVAERKLGADYGVDVLAVVRGERRHTADVGMLRLQAGDVLIARASFEELLALRDKLGVALPSDTLEAAEKSIAGDVLAELLVPPTSRLVGRTLGQTDFRRRFGAFVIGIRRHSATLRGKMARTALEAWDSLLALLPRDRLEALRSTQDLIVVSEHETPFRRQPYWWLVLLVLPMVVLLAAFGVLEIAAAALLGATLLLVVKVLSPREAYQSIDWSVIFLVAAFVPVGKAVLDTGTAAFVADLLLRVAELLPVSTPYAVLSLLYLATSLLTQMVSNTAAALVVAPVGLSLAATLGVDARPYLIAVCFAASAEFMTPMGYQTNMMVYAPGGYRFLDYTKFGAPLNLLFWVLATVAIPWFWGF